MFLNQINSVTDQDSELSLLNLHRNCVRRVNHTVTLTAQSRHTLISFSPSVGPETPQDPKPAARLRTAVMPQWENTSTESHNYEAQSRRTVTVMKSWESGCELTLIRTRGRNQKILASTISCKSSNVQKSKAGVIRSFSQQHLRSQVYRHENLVLFHHLAQEKKKMDVMFKRELCFKLIWP